jgi:hypothetical protein
MPCRKRTGTTYKSSAKSIKTSIKTTSSAVSQKTIAMTTTIKTANVAMVAKAGDGNPYRESTRIIADKA